MNVSVGRCCPELAQAHSSVALAWHDARDSTPFGVTYNEDRRWLSLGDTLMPLFSLSTPLWTSLVIYRLRFRDLSFTLSLSFSRILSRVLVYSFSRCSCVSWSSSCWFSSFLVISLCSHFLVFSCFVGLSLFSRNLVCYSRFLVTLLVFS